MKMNFFTTQINLLISRIYYYLRSKLIFCTTDNNFFSKQPWCVLCQIKDVCIISALHSNHVAEVYHKTGIPYYFQFYDQDSMESFIGIVSGYYRLMVNWTIDLCKLFETPSIKKLKKSRCHGPVG